MKEKKKTREVEKYILKKKWKKRQLTTKGQMGVYV